MAKKKRKFTKRQTLEKKIREYRKILQKDEDWDWTYILRLLRYKLERTRKCIIANDVIVEAPKVTKQIREVEILLERVEQNRYLEMISKNFHKKYGQIRMITGKSKPGARSTPVHFEYTRETSANSKQINRESIKLWRQAERMQQRDLKKAFDLMFKNIWGWWD